MPTYNWVSNSKMSKTTADKYRESCMDGIQFDIWKDEQESLKPFPTSPTQETRSM